MKKLKTNFLLTVVISYPNTVTKNNRTTVVKNMVETTVMTVGDCSYTEAVSCFNETVDEYKMYKPILCPLAKTVSFEGSWLGLEMNETLEF